VVITGFDGYFNQAIAFQDTNNNGELDIDALGTEGADLVFGLTDANGQITVPNSIEGALALQTLTPGGTVQQALIAHNNDEFEVAGKYTIDMDHPSQAMAHELVFRAPTSSNVISPITDLVAIEAEKNGGDLEAAETAVNVALGGTDSEPVALYDDFVEGDNADAELHKTAQILTESKAANPTTYEEKSDQFAKEANALVDTLTPAELADNDLKPVIEDNAAPGEDLDPIVVTNNKLVVTASVLETEQGKIPTLEENGSSSNIVLDIAGLFVDKDQTLITPNLTHNIPAESGIVVTLNGDILTLVASDYIGTSGEFTVTLTAEDKNSTPEIVGSAIAIFNVKIEAANQIPAIDYDEYDVLQAEIDNWQLEVGVPFEQTINIENLFTDKDGDIVSYRTGGMTIPGLTVSPQEGTNPIITISGTPTKATATDASEAFMVGGVDNEGAAAYQEMLMPQVQEGTPVEPTKHPLEDKFLHFVEVGSNNTSFDKAWCDSIYLDSASKVMYWNNRDNDNLATCDTEMSEFEEGVSYQVVGDKIVSIENGMSMTLDIIQSGTDVDGERHLISFTDEEDGDQSVELYTYYTNAEYVEEMIYNPVNTSKDNADWADREAYIAMPPSEGSKEIVVTELHVNGIVQQFAHGDSMYTSASLHAGEEACDILKDIYFDYGDIRIHGDNTAADTYFHHEPSYHRESVDSCYIDFHPVDTTAVLPAGLYTIEAQPERFDEGERILFSFYK
jgi:hypothetical protein